MVNVYKITFKIDGNRNKLGSVEIKARSHAVAKMRFVDQGYGPMFHIVSIQEL